MPEAARAIPVTRPATPRKQPINRPRPATKPSPRARILGFDFGLKRIGVAVGNPGSGAAQPVATVAAKGGVPDWAALQKPIDEWQPAALAVGLPLNMDGSEGPMAKRARKFGRQLGARFNLPVAFVDERLTTRAAEELLRDSVGRGGGNLARLRSKKRDGLAAELIARAYLAEIAKSTVTATVKSMAMATATATVTATVKSMAMATATATVTATVTTDV